MKGAVLLACVLAGGTPSTAKAQTPDGDEAPSAFEAMKQLVGRWEGLSWDGTPGS